MEWLRALIRCVLTLLYRVKVTGLEHYEHAGERVLIIANHTSYLDAVLLAVFLPERVTFMVNTQIAKVWWVRLGLACAEFFLVDPDNPMAIKSLIKQLAHNRKAVVFPEGRITQTGSLMKIYQGPGLVADKCRAMILPIRIDGAQYTPFSLLRGRVRRRWFPPISLTILPPRPIELPEHLRGRARREQAVRILTDLMTEMMFVTTDYCRTVSQAFFDARHIHGGRRAIVEDVEGNLFSYNQLIRRAFVLGKVLASQTQRGEYVGLLLPTMVSTLITFLALHLYGRVPAMLNVTVGAQGLHRACETGGVHTVYTSRRFVETARLHDTIARLNSQMRIVYLEDLHDRVTLIDKLTGLVATCFARFCYRHFSQDAQPGDPAVMLFTSGSEGPPKGVVLSHANILANSAQVTARLDFNAQDVVLNALPMFHSFGLTAGTLLPLLHGVKAFLYPSPLHRRTIPELAYRLNATLLFGTNTFLAAYGRCAHPYDFYRVRYVFAGAEKLQRETAELWSEKFGIRLLEGYGATETSPVLAVNTPMEYRSGSVGRLLPGIGWYLEPVPGLADGGRLCVRGPNIMLGYMRPDTQGQITPPTTQRGPGWYDTGDFVRLDQDGFVWILGRAKRFAKIGGEMVSLAAVEEFVLRTWPGMQHAVVSMPDPQRGEQLVLLTEYQQATRRELLERATMEGTSALFLPKHLIIVRSIPLLANGKVDYPATQTLAQKELASQWEAAS
jgi:acyl-[acyl-carrier-protein]-phospholipid O-acyltransferase/long-chain-fatty-acid--[acyl-carrier-protein] ligase